MNERFVLTVIDYSPSIVSDASCCPRRQSLSVTSTPQPSSGALPQLSQCHSGRRPHESKTSIRVYDSSWPRNTAFEVATTQGTLIENQCQRRGRPKVCDASERSMQSMVGQKQRRARGVAMKSRGESRRVIHRGRGLQRRGAVSVGDENLPMADRLAWCVHTWSYRSRPGERGCDAPPIDRHV